VPNLRHHEEASDVLFRLHKIMVKDSRGEKEGASLQCIFLSLYSFSDVLIMMLDDIGHLKGCRVPGA
jgi:hypothetical protein